MTLADMPAVIAALNATSATLLVIAYVMIKKGRIRWHAGFMIAALTASAAFLTCYIIYHAHIGSKRFPIQIPSIRAIYFTILLTHTFLAAIILPLIVWTVWLAGRRRWARHRRIGPWTFWIWLYVSTTGVIIYWMLYHLPAMVQNT